MGLTVPNRRRSFQMRPTPFRPATTPADADERTSRWLRGEYDPTASLQEVLGFTDAEMEAWRLQRAVPPNWRGTLPRRTA